MRGLVFLLSITFSQSIWSAVLTMCVDHYPPLQIVDGDMVTGENVEVTKQWAKANGYELAFTPDTPFKRCLEYLKLGKVDVMTGVLGSKERAEYAHLLLYDDVTNKSFFQQRSQPLITDFDQLKGKVVAVLRGVNQFAKFDNARDKLFTVIEVNTLPAAFGMLYKGRVDVVVATDYYGRAVLAQNPFMNETIVESEYSEKSGTEVYIALSKRRFTEQQVAAIRLKTEQMFANGDFVNMILQFQSQYPNFYQ